MVASRDEARPHAHRRVGADDRVDAADPVVPADPVAPADRVDAAAPYPMAALAVHDEHRVDARPSVHAAIPRSAVVAAEAVAAMAARDKPLMEAPSQAVHLTAAAADDDDDDDDESDDTYTAPAVTRARARARARVPVVGARARANARAHARADARAHARAQGVNGDDHDDHDDHDEQSIRARYRCERQESRQMDAELQHELAKLSAHANAFHKV